MVSLLFPRGTPQHDETRRDRKREVEEEEEVLGGGVNSAFDLGAGGFVVGVSGRLLTRAGDGNYQE